MTAMAVSSAIHFAPSKAAAAEPATTPSGFVQPAITSSDTGTPLGQVDVGNRSRFCLPQLMSVHDAKRSASLPMNRARTFRARRADHTTVAVASCSVSLRGRKQITSQLPGLRHGRRMGGSPLRACCAGPASVSPARFDAVALGRTTSTPLCAPSQGRPRRGRDTDADAARGAPGRRRLEFAKSSTAICPT